MFQCPSCRDTSNTLVIVHSVTCRSEVASDESVEDYEVGDLEWDDTDKAECACGWTGTVKDMTIEETEDATEEATI